MRSTIRSVVIFAMFASATNPAFALSPEWDQCKDINNKDTADRAIAACTHILNDKSERQNHAMALRNRCGAKYTQANYDGALADCNQAINMEPKSDIGYERRGSVWRMKGDDKRAMADFDKALAINFKNPYALYARGTLKKRMGDEAGGDSDLARAREIKPDID